MTDDAYAALSRASLNRQVNPVVPTWNWDGVPPAHRPPSDMASGNITTLAPVPPPAHRHASTQSATTRPPNPSAPSTQRRSAATHPNETVPAAPHIHRDHSQPSSNLQAVSALPRGTARDRSSFSRQDGPQMEEAPYSSYGESYNDEPPSEDGDSYYSEEPVRQAEVRPKTRKQHGAEMKHDERKKIIEQWQHVPSTLVDAKSAARSLTPSGKLRPGETVSFLGFHLTRTR